MKVLVVSTPIFQLGGNQGTFGYSGLEVIAWFCAKGLAERGHEVALVAPDGSYCPGVRIIPIGPAGRVSEKDAYDRSWKEYMNTDVIIDHSWGKHSMVLKGEGRITCPSLLIMHAPVNTMLTSMPPNVEKPCFVCISNDQRNHFEALFGRPARVARNGIDMDFYKSIETPRNNRYLFLARFSSIKGPDLALQVCLDTNTELDMIGDTSITNEPELYRRCVDLADGKKIKIIGPCSRSETIYWFSRNNILLHLNQRFREPLGLAPLEGMACGMPCIGWRHGAMTETINPDISGWLVSSMDEVKTIINDTKDGIPESMRESAREWVGDNFSIRHMIDAYENLIQEAVTTGGW